MYQRLVLPFGMSCTKQWYLPYQPKVHGVPIFGSCRTTCWYTPYQLLVHLKTCGLIRITPRPLGGQALATVRVLL